MTLPYGSWPSPLTAALIAEGATGLGAPAVYENRVLWLERRASEEGRTTLVLQDEEGKPRELTPDPWYVRTAVHEYGGGDFLCLPDGVVFSNYRDQRLYLVSWSGGEPSALTPQADASYADGCHDPARRRMICVREQRLPDKREPENTLVEVPLDEAGPPRVLVSGHDFFAAPRLSPDGRRLAWITWDHPAMPWDGADLWLADLGAEGRPVEIRHVAGGPRESVTEPRWSPDGTLHFISDGSGFWNLYRWDGQAAEALAPRAADFSGPPWALASSQYGFAGDGSLIALCSEKERRVVLRIRAGRSSASIDELPTGVPEVRSVACGESFVVYAGDSPTELTSIRRLDLDTGRETVLRRSRAVPVDPSFFSAPEPVEFATGDGERAYGYYYPPHHPEAEGPRPEKPPLLVLSHGGPTSATSIGLSLSLQFWTTRGFAVLDVDYRGSSGYGRAYREKLRGLWGVADVEDCVAGARAMVEAGRADPDRLLIRGGSAGGYTTLCALTFHDTFAAGASYYGISDLEPLVRMTHKFESRYVDGLIAPLPEGRELYRQRSPLHHAERLSCPVIFFQGAEDPVVPPDQSERMHQVLREKGIPTALLVFEGERHGFRRSANIRRSLEAELLFYGRVLGFEPADAIEPFPIDNLD